MPDVKEKAAFNGVEMAELADRDRLIAVHRRTANLLESERNLFLNHLLTAKGLDPAKRYSLDPGTGELTEAPDG